jgi:hypothetical protein
MFQSPIGTFSFIFSQEGLVAIQPNLRLIAEHKILIRADIETIRNKQVTLISGGGILSLL